MAEETPELQPRTPVEKPKRGWLKIGLMVLGGLALIAVSAYAGYWYASRQQPIPTPTPRAEEKVTEDKASLKEWPLSMEEAADKVRSLPEVDEFLKRGETRKTTEFGTITYRPTLSVDPDSEPSESDPFWTIHVWEDVTEYNKDGEIVRGHSATFGWYKVNARTGEVIKEL